MAKYVIDESTLKGIGDAIRAKKGTSDPIPVPSLASEISSIESGGSDPTYKVIPLGKYVFHPNSEADLELSIAEWYDEVNDYYNLYPDWFTAYVESEERTITGFGMHCTFETSEVECYYSQDDWLDFYITDGTVITVITEIEVPEEQYNAFMQYFTPYTPEYNGVIPLGKYTFLKDGVAPSGVSLGIMYNGVDEEGGDIVYPNWFTAYDNGGTLRTCFGLDGGGEIVEAYFGTEFSSFTLTQGSTIEVITEIEVTEEQFNAFFAHFTPADATEPEESDTPTYNGVIPLGTYTLVRKDVWADEDAFDIIEDGDGNPLADWFTINGKGYFGIDYYEYSCDMYYNQTGYFCDSFEGDVTIEVTREIEVTEEQYNEFIKVFTLQ